MDQFYYESGYIDESYFVYTADAESQQTATSEITCDASVIAGGVAVFGYGDLPAFATLTCTISHINGADLFAFSEAALAAQAEVIRTTNVELSTQFSVAVSAVRGIYVSAQADSFVAMISAGSRSAGLEAAVDAAFSMTTDTGKIQEVSCDLTSAFTPTLSVDVFKNSFAVLESYCSLELDASLIVSNIIDVNSTLSITCSAEKIRTVSASIVSESTVSPVYGSYTNKRPRSIILSGITSPYGLTTAQKKYGTHSFYSPGDVGVNKSLRIQYSNVGNIVQSNQDFYISAWIYIPSLFSPLNTSTNLISGNGWNFGYRTDSGGNISTFFEYYNGSVWTRVLANNIGNFSQVAPRGGYWGHWEAFRSGSNLSFRFDNGFHGPTTKTVTYSSVIASSQSYIQLGEDGLATATVPAYFDELYMAVGTSQPQSYNPNGSIADGSLSTTKFLFHFDGNYYDDLTGIIQGPAALTSISTLSVNAEKSIVVSSSQTSTTNLSSLVTRIKPLDANIQTQGFLVAAAGRIRPFVDIEVAEVSLQASVNVITDTAVAVDAEFTEVVDATRNIGPITIDANATTELVASNVVTTDTQLELTAFATTLAAYGLIRPEVADLHAAFTVQAQIDAGKIAFANFDVAATLTAEASKTFGQQLIECPSTTSLIANGVSIPSGGVNMPAEFVQSTEGTRVRYNQAAISADTATTADSDVIRHLSGNLSSYSNSEINAFRIKQLQAHFDVISSEFAISAKIGDFLVDCAVDTTLTVDVSVKQSNSATLETSTNLTALGDANKPFAAQLEVNAFELVVAEAGIISGADIEVTTELAVHADVITSASIVATSTTTLTCRLDAVREGIAIEMSFGTMAVQATRTRDTECYPSAEFITTAQVTKVEQLSADLLVEGFTLAIGKVINLQASEVWVVPSDNYFWTVPAESTYYTIEAEDRTYIIEDK